MEEILFSLIETIGGKMPELRLVDEDYGQLEMIDSRDADTYPVVFPCVLVDSPSSDWSNVQGLSQRGVMQVSVRLAIDCYDDTHYTSGTTDKIKERMQLVEKLHKTVQGFSFQGQVCIRTGSRFRTVSHGIKVYEFTYGIAVSEYMEEEKVAVRIDQA